MPEMMELMPAICGKRGIIPNPGMIRIDGPDGGDLESYFITMDTEIEGRPVSVIVATECRVAMVMAFGRAAGVLGLTMAEMDAVCEANPDLVAWTHPRIDGKGPRWPQAFDVMGYMGRRAIEWRNDGVSYQAGIDYENAKREAAFARYREENMSQDGT